MRIIKTTLVALTFCYVDGKLPRVSGGRLLSAEAVGEYHTDAFEILGEKYSEEKPEHLGHVMRDLGDILASYCPDDDENCKFHANQSVRDEFDRVSDGLPRDMYPQEFDKKLQLSINTMISHVETLDELNLDQVLHSLHNIKDEIKDMKGLDESHVKKSLVGVSVAIESTKLWHATYYDHAHPLHDLIKYFDPENSNRRLQLGGLPIAQLPAILGVIEDCGIDTDIILADVAAAFNIGGVPAIQTNFANVTGVTDLGIAELAFFMPIVSASAAAFFNGGGGEYYGYYDGKDVDDGYYDDCWPALATLGLCF